MMAKKAARTQPPETTPQEDAWMTAFFIENHLDYFVYPDHVAGPEQVRFMVFTQEDERYYPCSDRMFEAIMSRKAASVLAPEYDRTLKRIIALVETEIEDPWLSEKTRRNLHMNRILES